MATKPIVRELLLHRVSIESVAHLAREQSRFHRTAHRSERLSILINQLPFIEGRPVHSSEVHSPVITISLRRARISVLAFARCIKVTVFGGSFQNDSEETLADKRSSLPDSGQLSGVTEVFGGIYHSTT